MDLSEIKNRLSAMQSKQGNSSGEKKNIYFKPSVGKESVRVVPNKFNKATPFTELYIHYGIGNKVMISPINWGEKDPIVEFAKQLRKTNDKDNWRLAKKLDPKLRIFAPVVVRGKESEGVKLWQFGKETYMDFLNLADNEDVGDFTDIVEGRDITLTTVGPEVTGTAYNKTNIMPRTKQTTLSDDKNLVESLLENQPNPMETFKKYSYDDMKQALQDWLNPEDEEEEETPPAKSAPVEEPASDLPWDNEPKKASKKYDIKTPTKPVSKADKFDALFDDEDEDA